MGLVEGGEAGGVANEVEDVAGLEAEVGVGVDVGVATLHCHGEHFVVQAQFGSNGCLAYQRRCFG